MLDLFDVNFSEEGAICLSQALIENKTLQGLYLSNTKVSMDISEKLLKVVLCNHSLKVFKWVNLYKFGDYELDVSDRAFDIESHHTPISKFTFYNQERMDLCFTIFCDFYKCPWAPFPQFKDQYSDE